MAGPQDLGEVASPSQQAVGNARCAPRSPRDLVSGVLVDGHAEELRAARNDAGEVFGRVEVEADDVAEARAEGRGARLRTPPRRSGYPSPARRWQGTGSSRPRGSGDGARRRRGCRAAGAW